MERGAHLRLENDSLIVEVSPRDATLTVTDKRRGAGSPPWRQQVVRGECELLRARASGRLEMDLLHRPTGMQFQAGVELEADEPEIIVTIEAEGALAQPLRFPEPFVTWPGTHLVLPINEGIAFPVDDESVRLEYPNPWHNIDRLEAYDGSLLSMAFFGACDDEAGAAYAAIFETPSDATAGLTRHDGLLCASPEWDAQKGAFGYARRVRYVFFDTGGHVAICKRYRRHARQTGLLRTLAEKRDANPNVDLLVGAVNVWYWGDALAQVREMRQAGIERMVWGMRQSPDVVAKLNGIPGVLTSSYDQYHDVVNPADLPRLRKGARRREDFYRAAWPDDIALDENGRFRGGWQFEGPDGKRHPSGLLCDTRLMKHARPTITEDLRSHAYRCRFMDVTCATPWRECYHTEHPMTRTESRRMKTGLLEWLSGEMNLVVGSETGHEAAVPFVHYFEGMLSLRPYRIPDAGRNMREILHEIPDPDRVKIQIAHEYRLPLWELVYHDCVAAHWYWGDYNNKMPAFWRKRDLFNVLYGTAPMFMFDEDFWRANRGRFVESYRTACPVARATGYAEMTDHRFLTADGGVQQTRFADGTVVTVNFADDLYRIPGGAEVAPMGHHVGNH